MADVFSAFGLPCNPLDYHTFVQLSLNEDRVRLRQANALALAFQAATSDAPLGSEWADALGRDPLEGGDLVDQANAARARARASRNRRPGWGA